MVWVVLAAVFLYLLGWSLAESGRSTASRPVALLSVLLDGLAMVVTGLGVFGLMMAVVLGIMAEKGPRLVGQSLRDTLIWSAVLIVVGLVMTLAGRGVRGIGARRPAEARPARGL